MESNHENLSQQNQVKKDDQQYKLEKLRLEQNLPFGTLAAVGAALLGAILWAVITVATGYQIGYMAIAVGFIVGFANRYFGKGIDQIFGIIGAILALAGCILGNILSIVSYTSTTFGIGYFDALSTLDFSLLAEIMKESFSPIDLLFYGLAIYQGYKFSFRVIEEEPATSPV